MHDVALVLCEVDQVDPVLFRVEGPLVDTPFAIVDDNLPLSRTVVNKVFSLVIDNLMNRDCWSV